MFFLGHGKSKWIATALPRTNMDIKKYHFSICCSNSNSSLACCHDQLLCCCELIIGGKKKNKIWRCCCHFFWSLKRNTSAYAFETDASCDHGCPSYSARRAKLHPQCCWPSLDRRRHPSPSPARPPSLSNSLTHPHPHTHTHIYTHISPYIYFPQFFEREGDNIQSLTYTRKLHFPPLSTMPPPPPRVS